MSLVEQFNIGTRIRVRTGLPNTSFTQSSAALSTTQDGITVDRLATGLRRYYSCKIALSGIFTANASQATAVAKIALQHSSDGTSWDNFSTGNTGAQWGTSSSGNTLTTTSGVEGTVEQSVNLNGARRYLRVQIPTGIVYTDCSSGSAIVGHAVVIFGGADELPAQ